MTSPTKEYLQKEGNVKRILSNVDIGGLETKFESTKKDLPPMAQLPDYMAFYDNGNKVGELHFLEEPMKINQLNKLFEPYANNIRKEINQ